MCAPLNSQGLRNSPRRRIPALRARQRPARSLWADWTAGAWRLVLQRRRRRQRQQRLQQRRRLQRQRCLQRLLAIPRRHFDRARLEPDRCRTLALGQRQRQGPDREWAWPGPGQVHRGRGSLRTRGTSGTDGSHCGCCRADASEDDAPTEVPCTRYHA